MDQIAKDFIVLNPEQKRIVHLNLCEYALKTWQDYVIDKKVITYRDSVVGVMHRVDCNLPEDAMLAAKSGKDNQNIKNRYSEPILAMQDSDLEFPLNIMYAYYAIYNLYRKTILLEEIDDWLIVNQALSSDKNQENWDLMLRKAINPNAKI